MRALALLSGGLDSTLAIRVLQEQDIEITALNFVSVFCTCTPAGSSCSAARTAVRQLGVELKAFDTSRDFIRLVKDPKHGYGSEMNPCIDCRILMFRKAHDYMRQSGARFLVTGELLGQRPMSQRRETMKLIEREAGVEGMVVRPLCAQHMEPSIPEEEGWVEREKLLDIRGRSRKPQIALAEEYGIRDYPCPAGGCRLTDPGFALRMRDLVEHRPEFDLNDVKLLKDGRHFRIGPRVKTVVGRNEEENDRLRRLARTGDVLMDVVEYPSPITVVRNGEAREEQLRFSAAVTARYTKARNETRAAVAVFDSNQEERRVLHVEPATDEEIAPYRIDLESPVHKKQYADEG